MFREMRRSRQQLPETETLEILKNSTSGVLSLLGDEGYPYGVPLSYVYDNGRLLFHGAVTGHKIDAVKNYDKASFCVINMDKIVPENYTTHFKSVIVFGRVRLIEDRKEKLEAIIKLADKYSRPGMEKVRDAEIADSFDRMSMIELKIEHVTGKEAKELTDQRKR